MNEDIIVDEDKYNDWDNPYYQAGYLSGCETSQIQEPIRWKKLREERNKTIVELEIASTTIKKLEEKANDLSNTLDYLIRENNKPWYIKLWSKIPKISIQITRR